MCVGQPSGCIPSIDLTDVPLPSSDLQSAGCVPNPSLNGGCAENDPRFWITTATPQLGMLQIDFNHASTFWGVTFCNGRDGVVSGVTQCLDGVGGAPITASCPNVPPPHTGDCTWAALNIRQGIAALINCPQFVIDDTAAIGPDAVCMDNPTTPASGALHSGYPNDIHNPNNNAAGDVFADCTANGGCNTVGAYAVDASGNQVALGTPGSYTIGGACSWDTVLGCGTPAISAEHYYNDLTNSLGTNVPPCGGSGQPACSGGGVNLGRDFCNAAQHFIAAGLATGVNNVCELTGEFPNLASPAIPVVFQGRSSLGRDNLWRGLTSSLCQLIALGNTGCGSGQLWSQQLQFGNPPPFRTGCKNGATDGGSCVTQGPNTPANSVALGQPFFQSWDIWTGGSFFATPTPNTLWKLYDSSFASNYCGGSPSEKAPNYDYLCNSKLDTWGEQSQFLSSTSAALASLQVAQDIFGNHTFTKVIWTPSIQYPYIKGCTGITNASGIGTAQGNFWSLLNDSCDNSAVSGTIRWGQKNSTTSLNPYTFNSVVEADVFGEIYDGLLANNAVASSQQYFGWMANFVRVETHSTQPAECPASYTNSRGTFDVGACVRMTIRGDIPWHDIITACATPLAACLGDHVVTVSDIKFSFASFNATGALASPGTLNTIDIVGMNGTAAGLAPQLPASAFSSVGGTNGAGISETFLFLLHNNNAYAINDLATVPIIPQRLWACQANNSVPCTNVQRMPNGFLNPCVTLDTPACAPDPTLLSGPQSDPVATNRLIGSGPFVCASGDLGASGTVIGGGCTSSGTQSIPFNGNAVLRRFYQSAASGLDLNFAYFRSNEKFLQFQWAAYAPATNTVGASATVSDIISAINACKVNAAQPGGVTSYQACAHWNTRDAGVSIDSSIGSGPGVIAGGNGQLPNNPLPVTTQIQQWIGRGAWLSLPTGVGAQYTVLGEAQSIPQTLYSDGAVYGSFQIAASPTSLSHTSLPANVAISVALSGGPDNYFHAGDPDESVHSLNVTLACVTSTGLGCSLGTTSVTLTSASPTASTTLTISNAGAVTAGTVFVQASEAGYPSVTVKITVS